MNKKLSALLREMNRVVEDALSRSMSTTLIAEYQTHLPKKELLTRKLRELRELAEAEVLLGDEDGGDWE